MSTEQKHLQECGTLNRVFAAFFLNEAGNAGVNFEDAKPQMQQIASMNNGSWFFRETDSPHGLKKFFHGRVEIPVIDVDKFRSTPIYDFFDDEMQGQILGCARHFASVVDANKYCDFIFSNLPDAPPFLFDCIHDTETNFKSRLIIGHNFIENNYSAVWEFYCLLMFKFREVESHPIYGKSYKDVDHMTDEEREKFNKQPEGKVE